MSGSSDSEEFFDAEEATDDTCHRAQRRSRQKDGTEKSPDGKPVRSDQTVDDSNIFVEPVPTKPIEKATSNNLIKQDSEKSDLQDDNTSEVGSSSGAEKIVRSRRFREVRQRMQTEDEDVPIINSNNNNNNNSPPDSQTSSIEGVFPVPSRAFHPFRKIEHDTVSLQSMTSLGRVGRILAGVSDSNSAASSSTTTPQFLPIIHSKDSLVSASSGSLPSKDDDPYVSPMEEKLPKSSVLPAATSSSALTRMSSSSSTATMEAILQEPDVIASTKNNITKSTDQSINKVPVAPPRRKKKSKVQTSTERAISVDEGLTSALLLPSPASTIESLTREFEHSLDIRSATKGQYVVKPQDEDKARAESVPSQKDRETIEKIKMWELSNQQALEKLNKAGIVTVNNNSMGRYSLGPAYKLTGGSGPGSRERRKSAGDQDLVKQLNMFVRMRTDSGKRLTDQQILEQVTVTNLDTGERVPLSSAEDKLPKCINPLSLHIMRLTAEYVSNSNLEKNKESDDDSDKKSNVPPDEDAASVDRGMRKKTQKLKRFLGSTVKKTVDKAKSIAQEVSHARHKEDVMDIVDDVPNPGGEQQCIKLKASSSHKGPYEFDCLQHVQDLNNEHIGPVWCMKFSACGRLLATAGQDRVLRIWVLRDAYKFFQDRRSKYTDNVSPTPSQESLVSHHSIDQQVEPPSLTSTESEADHTSPFMPKPFCTYTGHTSDLLDVSWSKNYFVLSSSMDKTVRLWHLSRKECLCCFQHIDFVTAIVFHPRDDRYFLSGSLDGKLRLWNIPDKKVAVWSEVDSQVKLITAANFCQDGKFAVVGTYDGKCIFYLTDKLKYHTVIHVKSTRGKNSIGRKISGIEPMPGEDKILVTSNDSRIRLYDLRDLNLSCKYKGYVNMSSQIKASFSPDGQYIVSGSENQCIYIWKTHHDYSKFSSVRRDRNDFWEGIKAHNATVTCAVFAPNPQGIIKYIEEAKEAFEETRERSEELENVVLDPLVEQRTKNYAGHVLVSADFNGNIKVFMNKTKPKHSSLPASALT